MNYRNKEEKIKSVNPFLNRRSLNPVEPKKLLRPTTPKTEPGFSRFDLRKTCSTMNLFQKPKESKLHLPTLKRVDRFLSKIHVTKKSSMATIQLKPLETIADEIQIKPPLETSPRITIIRQKIIIKEQIAKSGKVHNENK